MKRILVIEDNPVELEYIAVELKLKRGGYSVSKVSGIDTAGAFIEKWNDYPFDCVIIDLNMNNEYLVEVIRDLTNGGTLTGWVWLYYVAKPMLDKWQKSPKIIIYSEFINELLEYMEKAGKEESRYFESVVTISKADLASEPELLLKKVDELLS